jgi:hypothetical protein
VVIRKDGTYIMTTENTGPRTLAQVMREIATAGVQQNFAKLVSLGNEAMEIKGVLDTLTATVYEEVVAIIEGYREEITNAGGDGVIMSMPFAEGSIASFKLTLPPKLTAKTPTTRTGGNGTATGRVDVSNEDLLAQFGDRPYEGAGGAHGEGIDLTGATVREAFDLGAGDNVKDKHNARANVRKFMLKLHTS